MITWKCDEHSKSQEKFSLALLPDNFQQTEVVWIDQGLLYTIISAPSRVRSCEMQVLCPSKQPRSLPCKTSKLFHGSFNYLNVLLLVRPLQSDEMYGHCIVWEIWIHTVHPPLSPLLFKQRLVPHTVLTTPSSYLSPPSSLSNRCF